jgi:hypothetical protein
MDEKLKITEFQNDEGEVFLELGYDPQLNWGLTNWIGFLTTKDVQLGTKAMLELIKEHNIENWLNDNRQAEGSWDGVNDWLAEWWIPRIIEAGLIKYSVIVPKDLYAQLSTELMADNAESVGLKMINWDKEEDARAWLME